VHVVLADTITSTADCYVDLTILSAAVVVCDSARDGVGIALIDQVIFPRAEVEVPWRILNWSIIRVVRSKRGGPVVSDDSLIDSVLCSVCTLLQCSVTLEKIS